VRPVVRLHLEPGRVMSREEFLGCGDCAIAADGAVHAAPFYDPVGPRLNLDQHHDVTGWATLSSCEQAAAAVGHGLWDRFRRNGRPEADLWLNHIDPDAALLFYVLQNPDRLDDPALRRLVRCEGAIDRSAGALVEDHELLASLTWVFHPWWQIRVLGGFGDTRLLDELCNRIDAHLDGRGGTAEIDEAYDLLHDDGQVRVVRERGQWARRRLREDGITTMVAVRGDGPPWDLSIVKLTPLAPADLRAAFERLNALEGCDESTRHWGGSDVAGGAPRPEGTMLDPVDVAKVVTETSVPPDRPG
jgi:hypothetical protein